MMWGGAAGRWSAHPTCCRQTLAVITVTRFASILLAVALASLCWPEMVCAQAAVTPGMEELIRKRFEQAQPRLEEGDERPAAWRVPGRFRFFLPVERPEPRPAPHWREAARVRAVANEPLELIALLDDPSVAVQREASNRLVALGDEAAASLLKAMEEGGPRQQSLALWTLRQSGVYHGAMFPVLRKLTTDSDYQVRTNACAVLGRSDLRAIPLLMTALEDEIAVVRATAANSLAQFGATAEEAVPFLTDHLSDPSAHVRTNSVAALGKIGPWAVRFALDDVLLLLGDPHPQARSWAIWSLTQIDDEGLPALAQALADRRETIRSGAAEALGRIGSRAAPQLELLLDHEDPKTRAWAATALARLGLAAEHAAPKLLALVTHDDNAEVRYYAQAALSSMGRR